MDKAPEGIEDEKARLLKETEEDKKRLDSMDATIKVIASKMGISEEDIASTSGETKIEEKVVEKVETLE